MSKSITTLLIIEDDPMVLEILEEFVSEISSVELLGKRTNVRTAKSFLAEQQVELILLDISLPDGTGLELLKWIREMGLDSDVIMLTADHQSTSIEVAKRYGVYDYILKPFKFERLQEAIERFQHKKHILVSESSVTQSDVDQIIPSGQRISQQWQNQTYSRVIDYLKEHPAESFSASELASRTGISRVTARKYLENLEMEGVVSLELTYGSVGRPSNKYSYKEVHNDH